LQKLYFSIRRESAAGWGSFVFALMAASFILGFLLVRFNVLGALVATAICTVLSSFIYVVISNLTLAQALVMSLATAFVLQVGYLVGQFLCDPANRGKLGF
jgi:hypothetical protein